jgi:hypothetical protein
LFLLIALPVPGALALGIVNGDFSNGFSGWTGTIVQDMNGLAEQTPVDPSQDPAHFSLLPGGGAALTIDSIYYQIVLSQVFDVAPNTLYALNFKYTWNPTDAYVDTFQASLAFWDGNSFGFPIDLFTTSPPVAYVDPPFSAIFTSPTTGRVRLDFVVTDNDYDTTSLWELGIEQVIATNVPEPGTVLLLGAGILALLPGLRRKRS